MANDKLNIGVIGLSIGAWHVEAFQGNPGSNVTAICDLDPELLASVGDKFSVAARVQNYSELLSRADVDAVSVCLPNFLHKPVAVAALQAGKHVLIEKPLALTPEEGEEIKAAAHAAGRTAMVAMKMRYGGEAAYARSVIESGRIGSVYYGNNIFIRPYNAGLPLRPWFSHKATGGGGALYDNGVHLLDLHWYLAGRPKPVQAMSACFAEFGPRGKGMDPECAKGFDVEDFASGMIRFADGSAIMMENAWLAHTDAFVMQLRIYGTEGGLALWPLRVIEVKDGKDEVEARDYSTLTGEDQFSHFLRCIRTGETPCSSIDDGIQLLRMMSAMYKSSELGRSVDL